MQTFVPSPPVVGVDRMLRIQRYTDMAKVRKAVRRAAEKSAALAAERAEPRVWYHKLGVEQCTEKSLMLEQGVTFHSAAFSQFLTEARQVSVFVLTLGKGLDQLGEELSAEGDLLSALFLETAGWLCIEDATRQFIERMREEAGREGYRLTRRMGPGYTFQTDDGEREWPLEDQRTLFGVFQSEGLPVDLLDSGAMLPKMSRSGLVGVRPDNRE